MPEEALTADIVKDLQRAAGVYYREAALCLASNNLPAAVRPLSIGTACSFYGHRIRQSRRPISRLLETTIVEANAAVDFWATAGSERNIINSYDRDRAYNELSRGATTAGKTSSKLFWLGYFFAEQWANSDALAVFKRLAERAASVRVLHWTGNLLAKLGRFAEAEPYLLRAKELEPERYNHHSHLGNIYRGLHRHSEARACYLEALDLIRKRPIGRVEHIHLIRCYHGLARLGEASFKDLEQKQAAAATSTGAVAAFELERIKF